MAGKYNLSSVELELMEFIWQHKNGVYFKDLMQHFVKDCGKEWKRQSLRTFLLNLTHKGVLEIRKDGKVYVYAATCTKKEHIQKWTKKLLEEVYDDSLTNFLCALGGETELSEEEMTELKEFIEE